MSITDFILMKGPLETTVGQKPKFQALFSIREVTFVSFISRLVLHERFYHQFTRDTEYIQFQHRRGISH